MEVFYFFKNAFIVVEFAAAALGFFYFQNLKRKGFGSFPFFLLIVFLLEVVGYTLALKQLVSLNQNLNKLIITPIIFLYYFWLYSREIKIESTRKKIFFATAAIYLAVIIFERFYLANATIIFSISRSTGTVILLGFVISYFVRLLQSDVLLKFKSDFLFWISLGCLIYYGITFPYFAVFAYLPKEFPNIFYAYSVAILPLRYFLYVCYITGILCSRKKL